MASHNVCVGFCLVDPHHHIGGKDDKVPEGHFKVFVRGGDVFLHVVLENVVEYPCFHINLTATEHETKAEKFVDIESIWLIFIFQFRLIEQVAQERSVVLKFVPRLFLLKCISQLP